MNILSIDYNTFTLVLTFIPIVASAILSALCFYRLEYGYVGKCMVGGLAVLVLSLAFGLMFNASYPREYVYQTIAGTTRLFGWSLISLAFLVWFLEIDRSIP